MKLSEVIILYFIRILSVAKNSRKKKPDNFYYLLVLGLGCPIFEFKARTYYLLNT